VTIVERVVLWFLFGAYLHDAWVLIAAARRVRRRQRAPVQRARDPPSPRNQA